MAQAAKRDLRKRIKEVLRQIPAESISEQSQRATRQLLSLKEYQNANRISIYLSMPSGELSTHSIVTNALQSGKQVFVPYIHPPQAKTAVMDMLALESLEEYESLKPDNWGIPSLSPDRVSSKLNCLGGHGVPADYSDTTQMPGLDMVVMPGMAFGERFRRLGHGKGYYDNFLKRYMGRLRTVTKDRTVSGPFRVALCLNEQILPDEEVPVTDHDWPMEAIITGDGEYMLSDKARQHGHVE